MSTVSFVYRPHDVHIDVPALPSARICARDACECPLAGTPVGQLCSGAYLFGYFAKNLWPSKPLRDRRPSKFSCDSKRRRERIRRFSLRDIYAHIVSRGIPAEVVHFAEHVIPWQGLFEMPGILHFLRNKLKVLQAWKLRLYFSFTFDLLKQELLKDATQSYNLLVDLLSWCVTVHEEDGRYFFVEVYVCLRG